MSETGAGRRGRTQRHSGGRRPRPKFLRCGLNHYLWAHGYQVRHRRGLYVIERVKNSSEASRAERAIYERVSEEKATKSEPRS